MHFSNLSPIAEALLVVAAATLSGLAFCTLIAGTWIAIHRHHEADAPPSFPSVEQELEIPPDREFVEVGTVAPRGPLRNVGSTDLVAPSAQDSSSFPHDAAYDFQNPKRF